MSDIGPNAFLNTQGNARDRNQRGKGNQHKTSAICRTCGRCRAKKIKCDSTRPSCNACLSSKHTCIYPVDERRSSRPTKAQIEALQVEVATLRNVFHSHPGIHSGSGVPSPSLVNGSNYSTFLDATKSPSERMALNFEVEVDRSHIAASTTNQTGASPRNGNHLAEGASPSEAELACAIAEDGTIEVHGRTSHLRRESFTKPRTGNAVSGQDREKQIQIIKDQLFAYAALQRQIESTALAGNGRQLTNNNIDLDGVSSEMANHLFQLHWNRQHFAYLLTYRPAIIDSLLHGGPYSNKLLLNAIYYSSCLYSDRRVFCSNPDDPESMGWNFYLRFKQHLMEELDKPSLPSIAALLICGATLVSNGKQSAGWNLCGLAYRMVVDLGCHLGFSHEAGQTVGFSRPAAIEIELRTRIYWGAFLTDKFQSLYFGRQPTLRASEGRVAKTLLDYHEEYEQWSPYVDETSSPGSTHIGGFAGPQPVYAISTFQALIPLAEIAETIASTFYGLDSVKQSGHQLLQDKNRVKSSLDHWRQNLPVHLRFEPTVDPTPPPNQITPHATYHTLIILLERPFLAGGHLSFSVNPSLQKESSENCRAAALQIWHIVDAYKRAFTLRRSPYFLSYATYSAIVVMLHQTDTTSLQYVECIRFFWFALLDFQNGCTRGLKKPLKILQALMQRLGQQIPDWDPRDRQQTSAFQSLDANEMGNSARNLNAQETETGQFSGGMGVPDLQELLQQSFETTWMESMMDSHGFVDDSLFGLFTPGQPNHESFGGYA